MTFFLLGVFEAPLTPTKTYTRRRGGFTPRRGKQRRGEEPKIDEEDDSGTYSVHLLSPYCRTKDHRRTPEGAVRVTRRDTLLPVLPKELWKTLTLPVSYCIARRSPPLARKAVEDSRLRRMCLDAPFLVPRGKHITSIMMMMRKESASLCLNNETHQAQESPSLRVQAASGAPKKGATNRSLPHHSCSQNFSKSHLN